MYVLASCSMKSAVQCKNGQHTVLKWLDRNRGGYHYCTRVSAAQSQIVPGQTLMARGGKTAARNRSSVVSRRTAVPDAIVNFYWGSLRCDCSSYSLSYWRWTVIYASIFVHVWVLWGSWFLQWSVMTSGYCGFVTAVYFVWSCTKNQGVVPYD
jgi:hypothetical protein